MSAVDTSPPDDPDERLTLAESAAALAALQADVAECLKANPGGFQKPEPPAPPIARPARAWPPPAEVPKPPAWYANRKHRDRRDPPTWKLLLKLAFEVLAMPPTDLAYFGSKSETLKNLLVSRGIGYGDNTGQRIHDALESAHFQRRYRREIKAGVLPDYKLETLWRDIQVINRVYAGSNTPRLALAQKVQQYTRLAARQERYQQRARERVEQAS